MLLLAAVPVVFACNEHIIPRTSWPQLNGFSTDKPKLVKAKEGMIYVTSMIPLALVKKYGRIKTRFTSIRFIKGRFVGLTTKGRRIALPLNSILQIVAIGKLAGEISGKKEDTKQENFQRPMSPGFKRY